MALAAWLGHTRIDETMLYVHVAEGHMHELPEAIRAYMSEPDPDARIIRMLSARAGVRGKHAAKAEAPGNASLKEALP